MFAEQLFIDGAINKVKNNIPISINEFNYLKAIYCGIDKPFLDKAKKLIK